MPRIPYSNASPGSPDVLFFICRSRSMVCCSSILLLFICTSGSVLFFIIVSYSIPFLARSSCLFSSQISWVPSLHSLLLFLFIGSVFFADPFQMCVSSGIVNSMFVFVCFCVYMSVCECVWGVVGCLYYQRQHNIGDQHTPAGESPCRYFIEQGWHGNCRYERYIVQ